MAQKPTPEKPAETREQATGGTGEDQMRSTAGLPAQGQADEANDNPIVTTATAAQNKQNDKPTLGKDRLHGPNMDEVLRAGGTPKPRNEDERASLTDLDGSELDAKPEEARESRPAATDSRSSRSTQDQAPPAQDAASAPSNRV